MPPKKKAAPRKQKQKQKQTTRVVVNVNSNNKRKTTSATTSKAAQMPLIISSVMPAVTSNPTPAADINRAAEIAQLRQEMQQGINYTLAHIQAAKQQQQANKANMEAQTEAATANDAETNTPFIQTASVGTGEQVGVLSTGTSPMEVPGQKRQRALRSPEKDTVRPSLKRDAQTQVRPKSRSAATNTAQTFTSPVMRTPKPEPMDISPIPPHPRSAVRKLVNAFEEKAGHKLLTTSKLERAARVALPGSSVPSDSSSSSRVPSVMGYSTSGVSSSAPTEYTALQKLSRQYGDLTNAKGKKLNELMYSKASKPEYAKLEFKGKPMGELVAKRKPMDIAAAIGIHKNVYTMDDYAKPKPTIEEYYGYKRKPIPDAYKASTSRPLTRSRAKK